MSTITISELRPSYLVDMEANEMTAVFGGFQLSDYVGFPDLSRGVVFTPVGIPYGFGDIEKNVKEAFNLARDFASHNGMVFEVIHGGSYGFYALPAFFPRLNYYTA